MIELRFSQYMDIASVNSDNITFIVGETALTGAFAPVDAEMNYDDSASYATIFSIISDKRITDDMQAKISSMKNYARTEIDESYSASHSVTVCIQTIIVRRLRLHQWSRTRFQVHPSTGSSTDRIRAHPTPTPRRRQKRPLPFRQST